MLMVPSWTRSQTQCHCISMCLDRLWNWGFFVIVMAPSLSPSTSIRSSLCSRPSSLYRLCSQQASCADSNNAMYSASVKDSAVVICFFEHHVMAPSAMRKTYPVMDLFLSAFPYAASVLRSWALGPIFFFIFLPSFCFPDRYVLIGSPDPAFLLGTLLFPCFGCPYCSLL